MKIFEILLYSILILFPLGQLTKLPLDIQEVNVYLHDLLIATLIIFWLLWHFLKKTHFPRPPLMRPILLFFTFAFFSLLFNSLRLSLSETVIASLYLWRWIFYACLYFVVFEVSQRNNILISKLRSALVLAGTCIAVLGLIQYLLYPDLQNLVYLGWDPHRYRVFGTFFDPNFLGIILVMNLILLISMAWDADQHLDTLTYRKTKIIGLVISYLALALTYSRSSYLAYLVAMGTIAWIKRSPKFFLTIFLIGVLTILALPRPSGSEGVRLEREESGWARIRNWRESLTIAKDNPILGVGFNAYRYAQKKYTFLDKKDWQSSHAGAGADSSLFFVLATTGILGLFIFGWLIYHILIYRINRGVIWPSTIAILIHSLFNNSFFYPWIMIWMWIFLGVEMVKVKK